MLDAIANEAAERAVIGSILIDAAGYAPREFTNLREGGVEVAPGREPYADNALAVAKARLRADDFTLLDCQHIYRAMLAADAVGLPVDVITLGPYLAGEDVWDTLISLGNPEVTPSAANVAYYVDLVADAATRRRLQLMGEGVAVFAADPTETVDRVLDRAEGDVAEARKHATVEVREFDLPTEIATTRARLDGEDGSTWRWHTGVEAIDKRFGGIGIGEHWVIGGRSGHMKTALACNIMLWTLQAGHRVAMFRYEESRQRMYMRLASLACGVPYGAVDEDDEARDGITAALDGLAVYDGLLEVHVGLTTPQCQGVIERFKPTLVVYDTLQAMTEAVGKSHEARRDLAVQSICQHVSSCCTAPGNEHAAILISQLQKGEGMPTMRQLRESGAIEEAADVCLLLWWPHKELDTLDPESIVIRTGKNRITGRLGKSVSSVEPGTQRFGDRLSQHSSDEFLRSI